MTIAKSFNRFIFSLFILFALFPLGNLALGQNIFLADSHLLGSYQTPDKIAEKLLIQKLTPANHWAPSNCAESWADANDQTRTFVYLHGNDTGKSAAIQDGFVLARHFNEVFPDKNYRLVIWYWDSRKTSQPLRQDILMKKYKSDYVSFYLAWFVQQAAQHTPVGLIGYSFGANSALGAAHLLAGGSIFNHRLFDVSNANSVELASPVSALLVAPAVPATSFVGGIDSRNQSLKLLSSVALTINGSDPALRWYHLLYQNSQVRPSAMGYVGVQGVPDYGVGKIKAYPMESVTGATHQFKQYVNRNTMVKQFATVGVCPKP